jgi:lipoprotein-releasing system permease protein
VVPDPGEVAANIVPVYQALLTRRYLTSKLMPLLAMAAVMLSVATVLITWSVMGGFLDALLRSGRALIGDVAIDWPNVGFAHYDELVEDLEAHDDIAAATATVETFSMLSLPDGRLELAFLRGVEPAGFDAVTGYYGALWWKRIERRERKDRERLDLRFTGPEEGDTAEIAEFKARDAELLDLIQTQGKALVRRDAASGDLRPAVVLGIEVTGLNERTSGGVYRPSSVWRPTAEGEIDVQNVFMPRNGTVGLTIIQLDRNGVPTDALSRRMPVANEFQSGIFEADSSTVLAPFEWVQRMVNLGEATAVPEGFDPLDPSNAPGAGAGAGGGAAAVVDPARATTVLVRGRDGLSPDEVKSVCREVYREFAQRHAGRVPAASDVRIQTWADRNRTMVDAVKNETGLVLFIFGIVCFTTVFLVLAIFWSMVSEKTRDIGVLRSLGASMSGVAWVWLRYGIVIGVVGGVLGVALGWGITHNINAIHDWLGEALGIVVWDARVYYFTEIPRRVDSAHAAVVFGAGVLTCLIGAAIPAVRAARMDPVRALRFE